jgi:lipopolysaccharide transport protein LptA
MAPSGRKLRWLPAVALATAAAGPATVPLQPGQQPITVDAASSEVDYRTNTLVFSQVVITQGTMRIQAEHAHATGLNFANSRWTFDGHVRVDADPRGKLRSDEAIVEFRDNRIARATVTGTPAEFEQQLTGSQQIAHGHADQIVYDVTDGIVRLENDAWLSDGQRELTAAQLVYNIRAQSMQAASVPGGQRVHILINPNAPPPSGKDEPPKGAPDSPRQRPPNPHP